MKKILVYFTFLLTMACGKNLEVEVSGNMEIDHMHFIINPSNGNQQSSAVNMIDATINFDIYNESTDSKIAMSPSVLATDSKMHNSVLKEEMSPMEAVYLNELYLTQGITKSFSVSAGLFPFRKGTFYEHSFNGTRLGNGLYGVTDTTFEGYSLNYTNKQFGLTINTGEIYFDKYFKSFYDYNKGPGPITFDSYKDSGGKFFILKRADEKLHTEFNYYNFSQVVNGVEIINSNIYSIGSSYDRLNDLGLIVYGTYSKSFSSGNNTSLSPTKTDLKTKSVYFGDFKTDGKTILFGITTEFDGAIFNRDLILGAEYLKRTPGYHSLLAGRPVSPHSYSDIGTLVNLNIGTRINKHNIVKLRFLKYDSGGKTIFKGATPMHTDIDNVGNSIKSAESFVIQYYFEF